MIEATEIVREARLAELAAEAAAILVVLETPRAEYRRRIGEVLLSAREICGSDIDFGKWREANLPGLSQKTAWRYMENARSDMCPTDSPVDLPKRTCGVIYADPPWRYDFSRSPTRDIENQYPTMDDDAICAMPVRKQLAAENCVLFLWVPAPKLKLGLRVLESWGFEYKTHAVWDKEIIGMGYYFRSQHEDLFVGVFGEPPMPDEKLRVSSIIKARRQQHSKKPAAVYKAIERMYPEAQRIELFARNARKGWDRWGNQA